MEQEKTNRPPGDAFRQQKLKAWQPIMTPFKVVAIFIAIGVAFIPTGTTLLGNSNDIYESTIMYDGDEQTVDCSISTANAGKPCTVTFTFDEDVQGPIYVYYKVDNFYQNHRVYVNSRDSYQLAGQNLGKSDIESTCSSLYETNNTILNPCGLIANSYFNDEISLSGASSTTVVGLNMDESDIAWASDKDKFKQVDGFESAVVSSTSTADAACIAAGISTPCKFYNDSGTLYLYHYPDESTVTYLYESYPNQISPLEGVTDQHFMVWMRTAALPSFRKLYGVIDGDFHTGDTLVFNVVANFEVDSFSGSKSIVISDLGEFGGKNPYLGIAYIVVGSISLMFATLFLTKQMIAPRAVADPNLLNWN